MAAEAQTDGAFSDATRAWEGAASLNERKKLGQFMTPRFLRERLLDQLELWPGIRVLDPGVGTGEFLRSVLEREPQAEVHGWDVDERILRVAERVVPQAHLERRSALEPYQGEPFDLVVGNPPYFQFRAPPEVRAYFARVISGRPNIFALFFQSGMEALGEDGRLAYVVPPSMNNGAYFEALREYIVEHSGISFLEVYRQGMFKDAQTSVQLIVMRRGAHSRNFVFERICQTSSFRRVIFGETPGALAKEFEGRSSLWDLGYEAVTGTVVWNQHREKLRQDAEPGTVPLLWAHNIKDGQIQLGSTEKRPQHIHASRALAGPALIVNRIVGSVGSGELRVAEVPSGMAFVGENHVNVIRAATHREQLVGWSALRSLLSSPEIASRVRRLTGNTQISATELTHLVPLDHETGEALRAA